MAANVAQRVQVISQPDNRHLVSQSASLNVEPPGLPIAHLIKRAQDHSIPGHAPDPLLSMAW